MSATMVILAGRFIPVFGKDILFWVFDGLIYDRDQLART